MKEVTKTMDLRWVYRSPIAFGIEGRQVLQQKVIIRKGTEITEEWRDVGDPYYELLAEDYSVDAPERRV